MAERETALVTGASGGIGEELARLLAANGHDLLLVARNGEKLGRLAATLAAGHGGLVEILPLDLSTPAAPERVMGFLEAKGIQPGVLVNNAGYGTFGFFAESELQAELGQIHLNVTALTHLTRQILPGMIARRRGRILNVASTAAFQPGPLMAVYFATKAYVLSFSEAIANELKGTGVTVTCLCPGPTRTGFQQRAGIEKRVEAAMMEADDVARRGYAGMLKGKRLVIPGLLNKLMAHSTRLGSRALSAKVVRGLNESLRKPGAPKPG